MKFDDIYRWEAQNSDGITLGYVVGRTLEEAEKELEQRQDLIHTRVRPNTKIPVTEVINTIKYHLNTVNIRLHNPSMATFSAKMVHARRETCEASLRKYIRILKNYEDKGCNLQMESCE